MEEIFCWNVEVSSCEIEKYVYADFKNCCFFRSDTHEVITMSDVFYEDYQIHCEVGGPELKSDTNSESENDGGFLVKEFV